MSAPFHFDLGVEELAENAHHIVRKIRLSPFSDQVVSATFNRQQIMSCRNQFQRRTKFFQQAEGIAGTVHEQRGCFQAGKMRRSQLNRLARRMRRSEKTSKPSTRAGFSAASMVACRPPSNSRPEKVFRAL